MIASLLVNEHFIFSMAKTADAGRGQSRHTFLEGPDVSYMQGP